MNNIHRQRGFPLTTTKGGGYQVVPRPRCIWGARADGDGTDSRVWVILSVKI